MDKIRVGLVSAVLLLAVIGAFWAYKMAKYALLAIPVFFIIYGVILGLRKLGFMKNKKLFGIL